MDFQDEIVANFPDKDLVPRVAEVLAAARKAGMLVVFVVVGFRPGYPEVGPTNKSFSGAKAAGRFVNPSVIDALKPLDGEAVVTKRRVSAFGTTDLPTILKAHGVNHIVLAGISTSGVILSTTGMAADMDYEITILSDCCADNDPEVHRVLMEKILPRRASVIESKDFLSGLVAQ